MDECSRRTSQVLEVDESSVSSAVSFVDASADEAEDVPRRVLSNGDDSSKVDSSSLEEDTLKRATSPLQQLKCFSRRAIGPLKVGDTVQLKLKHTGDVLKAGPGTLLEIGTSTASSSGSFVANPEAKKLADANDRFSVADAGRAMIALHSVARNMFVNTDVDDKVGIGPNYKPLYPNGPRWQHMLRVQSCDVEKDPKCQTVKLWSYDGQKSLNVYLKGGAFNEMGAGEDVDSSDSAAASLVEKQKRDAPVMRLGPAPSAADAGSVENEFIVGVRHKSDDWWSYAGRWSCPGRGIYRFVCGGTRAAIGRVFCGRWEGLCVVVNFEDDSVPTISHGRYIFRGSGFGERRGVAVE